MKTQTDVVKSKDYLLRLLVLLAAVLFLTLVIQVKNAVGQSIELGVQNGVSKYIGDLTPVANDRFIWNRQLQLRSTHTAHGFYLRHHLIGRFNYRINVSISQLSGDDRLSDDPGQQFRNLHFRTSLMEYALTTEMVLLHKNITINRKKRNYSIYAGLGAATFFINPQARYEGKWYDLETLGTEGQGTYDPSTGFYRSEYYSLIQFAIPMHGGLKYYVNDQVHIGCEFGYRKTFTDYIDDVSGAYPDPYALEQSNGDMAVTLSDRSGELKKSPDDFIFKSGSPRGDSSNKDAYFFAMITLGIKLKMEPFTYDF